MSLVIQEVSHSDLARANDANYYSSGPNTALEVKEFSGSISTSSYSSVEVYRGTEEKLVYERDILLIEEPGVIEEEDWSREWHKKYSKVFQYIVSFGDENEPFALDFFASVHEEWSSEVKAGNIPSEWRIYNLSNNIRELVFDTTLPKAVQYGREEAIAEKATDYDKVEYCKRLTDIDWEGMELTNPVTEERELFSPGDLHLTSIEKLYNKIGAQTSEDYVTGYLESTIL